MKKKQNNLGIGVDIEEIQRFKKLDIFKNRSFLYKIYTKKELAYCFKKASPGVHLAGRFVAKEAIFKALAALGRHRGISFKKIEILAKKNGAPYARVVGNRKDTDINLSISHCKSLAVAFVIVRFYEDYKRKN